MKTETVGVFSTGDGRELALELTERTGAYCALDERSVLRLRLLSEELIELIRSFNSDLRGEFWLETVDDNIEIHLKTVIPMDKQTRKELLSVSSSGTNSAAKGMMGKIRDLIESVVLPDDPETKFLSEQALGLMTTGSQMGVCYNGAYTWSMNTYAASVGNAAGSAAAEEKDDLEKSIVANLADEITVNIVESVVEVTIFKAYR
ncbi:MAG: hypothetical protein J5777_08790 [Clostridiales bacterium]|nr:hypothetical protein [Clostridiales bacterium]